jgi:multisubunit Na+/H+ antiporter MnhG subunit
MIDWARPMKQRRETPKSARWIGFTAAIFVLALLLLYPREFLGGQPARRDIYLFLGLVLVPASLAALLCFTRLFWTIALAGIWFLFLSVSIRSVEPLSAWSFFLVLGALAMLLAPIVAWALRRGDHFTETKPRDQNK